MNLQDLSLEKIETTDLDKLSEKIESFYKNDSSQKSHLSYHWERNHLMLDGQQWLVYEGGGATGGAWRKLEPSPANEYIPRPVTNYLYSAYQTLKGYILKNKPRSTVRANTQTNRDKSAAKIAELILECNYEKLREAYNYEYAVSCLLTYGTVFKKDFWDASSVASARVPRMQQSPVVDPATGMPTGQMEEVQAQDPATGEPLYDEIPLGDVSTAVVEPYRMALDPMAANLHDARWIMEYSIRPISWIVDNYDKQEEGYTGRANEVKEEKALPSSLRRFFQLKTSSGVKGIGQASGGGSGSGSNEMIENAAVVKEYYERPSRKYPKGRLFVVANNITLYASESPYEGPEEGDWHPYSECRWEIVPGRFWGKSPLDNGTEIQKQINGIDSVITLARKTTAVPQKLVPKGSVPPGQWTGQPGQLISYTPGPNGEQPSIIPASGVDSTVFQERQMKVSDLKEVMGALDILQGDRPQGVTAASALSLLFEVGTGRLYPILDRWKMFLESSQKKQLKLVAKKYREPRPEFIRQLMMRNRELTEDQIKSFIGTDLYDNCNVVIEAGSNIPRLKAGEQALLLEVAPTGALNLEDPKNKEKFRERLGITGFDSDFNKDIKRAEWENDLLDSLPYSPDNQPIVLDVDNHDVHIDCHSQRMKEPSFMSQAFTVQQAYIMHIEEHKAKKQEQMQEEMVQQAMMQPPGAPAPAPNHGNPAQQQMGPKAERVRAGKGVDETTQRLLGGEVGSGQGVGQ